MVGAWSQARPSLVLVPLTCLVTPLLWLPPWGTAGASLCLPGAGGGVFWVLWPPPAAPQTAGCCQRHRCDGGAQAGAGLGAALGITHPQCRPSRRGSWFPVTEGTGAQSVGESVPRHRGNGCLGRVPSPPGSSRLAKLPLTRTGAAAGAWERAANPAGKSPLRFRSRFPLRDLGCHHLPPCVSAAASAGARARLGMEERGGGHDTPVSPPSACRRVAPGDAVPFADASEHRCGVVP